MTELKLTPTAQRIIESFKGEDYPRQSIIDALEDGEYLAKVWPDATQQDVEEAYEFFTEELPSRKVFESIDIDPGAMNAFDDYTTVEFSGSAVTTGGEDVLFKLVCEVDYKGAAYEYVVFEDSKVTYCEDLAEKEIFASIGREGLKDLHLKAHQVYVKAFDKTIAIENCFVTVIGADVVFILPDGMAFIMAPAVDTDDEGAIEVWSFENVNDEAPIGGDVVSGETVAAIEAAGGSIIVEGAGVPLNELEKDALKEAENYCRGKDVAFTGPYFF